jgi:hypothetical protein
LDQEKAHGVAKLSQMCDTCRRFKNLTSSRVTNVERCNSNPTKDAEEFAEYPRNVRVTFMAKETKDGWKFGLTVGIIGFLRG